MSEATRKLRSIEAHTTSVCGVRDLAADAIEAVEAQVAEAVARVEKLEKKFVTTTDKIEPAPVLRFKPGDRVRFVAEPKWVKGYLGALGTIERIPGEATLEYYIASDVHGTNGDHVSANDADLEPAPSAVPAPRGFKKGDKVRHRDYPDEVWTVRHSPNVHGLVICDAPRPERWGAELAYHAVDDFLTLVRAADAPEAPKHMNDAVAGTSPAPSSDHASGPGCERANADGLGATPGTATPKPAPEAPAEEDTGLVVQRIRDEATKPLHVEIEKLRGEVARLTAERDDWKYAAEVQKKDMEGWKARAEAANIRADGHAEGLRSIRKMLTQSPPDVDRAILWCDDSLSGYTQSVAATEAETNDRALAAEARAEAAEKDRDTWKSEAEQRLKTLKFEGARAEALAKDLAEARAISAATAERVRTETQIATELRHELDDLRAKLAAAEQALDVERRTMIVDAAGTTHVCKTREDCLSARTMFHANLATARDERDALRAELDAAQGEMRSLRATISVLRADLAALRAKPRFRARKVRAKDAEAFDKEYYKREYAAGYEDYARAMNAVGLRRRVEQSK